MDLEKTTGKWVRYNINGRMVKGWDYENGKWFYFDSVYGTMAKGYATIEGTEYYGYYEALKNADGSSQAIIFTGMPSSDVKAIYKKRLVNTTVFMIIITLMACALLWL